MTGTCQEMPAASLEWNAGLFNANMGMPRHAEHQDVLKERIAHGRQWFQEYGLIWTYSGIIKGQTLEQLRLNAAERAKSALRRFIDQSAGQPLNWALGGPDPVVVNEIAKRWEDEKPDEFFILDTLASTYTQLALREVARSVADGTDIRACSPEPVCGDNTDLVFLLECLDAIRSLESLQFTIIESGMFRPKHVRLMLFSSPEL